VLVLHSSNAWILQFANALPGPIGSALTFLLKQAGARRLIVSEVSQSRQERARLAGADRIIDPTSEEVVASIKSELPNGVDIAFEACGLQVTLDTAIASVKPGGTIFNVAIHERPVKLDLNLLTFPEKRLVAGNAYTAEDYAKVIELLSSNGAEIERFITAVVPLEAAIVGGFLELSKYGVYLIFVRDDTDLAQHNQ
jgi:(R,R)-butanediol dehydrogenase / meso-butanediol dehydrogenase / diacetyl reductase